MQELAAQRAHEKRTAGTTRRQENREAHPRLNQHWVIGMNNSRGAITRNFQGSTGNTVRVSPDRNFRGNVRNIFRGELTKAPAFELTTAEWNEMSAEAFREHMREEGLSVKELADEIGCSDRTAENYVTGRTAPAGLHFLRALAVIPQFETRVRYVAALVAECDPRAQSATNDLVRAAMKFINANPQPPEAPETVQPVARDLFAENAA
jgi:transcriptional regulator with XRE-family HTH domain